ncbi:MAG: alpha/beta hydrolase [Thermoleophilia bacterium]
MSVGYVDVGGGRLWYEEAGEGPSILLLHGEAADSRMWDAQWTAFTDRFHTIRLELPGSGRTPYPSGSWQPSAVIECLLNALGIERVAVVGCALGGTLALDFVLERPDRVWAVVAASLSVYDHSDGLLDLRAAEVFTLLVAGRPSRAADLYLDIWCPLRTEAEIDAEICAMVHDNITMLTQIPNRRLEIGDVSVDPRVREIDTPALVIWGDRDERAAQAAAQRVATRVRHAIAMVLPETDHYIPMRAPEVFTTEVTSFLAQAAPAS